jgi:two-component system, cell cycle response regulator
VEADYEQKTRITALEPQIKRQGADCLVVIYAPQKEDLGRRYLLSKQATSIGRGPTNDIVLANDCVSRRHVQFEQRNGEVFVVDQSSTNGTFVNDEPQRVGERQLRRGDQVKVGDTIFKFLAGSDVEAQYHEVIFRMTVTDGLTNLCNRKQLDQLLEEEIPRMSKTGRELSLLMMDIDHFKSINDTHGHLTGDTVLRGLAAVMQKRLRLHDSLGRYGGEEFCAILRDTSLQSARAIAEELRGLVEAYEFMTEDGKGIRVTISIGAAQWKAGMQSLDLYKAADEHLYSAKRTGRNRVCA